jgi:molybdopterin molybdotransferase
MTKRFVEYVSLREAQKILRRHVRVPARREVIPLAQAYGRTLIEDIIARRDIPLMDSAHMDGYAVRSSDLKSATESSPVSLRLVRGSHLGVVPTKTVKEGEAHTVLTGGFMPRGADAVVQVERTTTSGRKVLFTRAPSRGEFVYTAGRDVKKGERVVARGRAVRGSDMVLIGSMHVDRVAVYARPRVAIIPTGSELTEDLTDDSPGKVPETHSFLLARLIEGAGGIPFQFPIASDDQDEITRSLKTALGNSDFVLTIAGSSVGDADLTETAIDALGRPGVLVHGMKVHRGRVMGFGAVEGKATIILPGPIQGAVNAFAVMAFPLIRSFLGRGFTPPDTVPAIMANDWDAGERFPNFTKVVYVELGLGGPVITAKASIGETEKMTFLTQNDGYLLVDEKTTSLKKGDAVRVYLLPGLSPSL